jgi:hypothetical protein
VPKCSDGGDNTPTSEVALVALEGTPPAEAIAIADDPSTAYIKPGYFTQRPHTAIHDLLYGTDPNVPDERGDECRQATTATVRANVQGASFGILHVKLLDSTEFPPNNVIFPDARTVITGDGANPHVEPGDLIVAEVLVCRKKRDPQFLKLVATRVSLPAPAG